METRVAKIAILNTKTISSLFGGIRTILSLDEINLFGRSSASTRKLPKTSTCSPDHFRRGTLGGSEHGNTAKKFNNHRITARKFDETPSPQYIFFFISRVAFSLEVLKIRFPLLPIIRSNNGAQRVCLSTDVFLFLCLVCLL